MKARWFVLLIGLVVSTALLSINAAGRKTTATSNPKVPPPRHPWGRGQVGQTGTITITHYATDGVTVLSTERVRASNSDSSASVAAALGKSAPEAVKAGAVTQWDDAGRPGAPVAQAESTPDTRTTASVKRLARSADCCSSSGCDAVEVTRDITGDIFGDWIGTFHHRVYWCWSYPRITGVNVACWSTVDGCVHRRPRLRRLGLLLQLARQRPRRPRLVPARRLGQLRLRVGLLREHLPLDRDLGERKRRLGVKIKEADISEFETFVDQGHTLSSDRVRNRGDRALPPMGVLTGARRNNRS